MENQFTILSGPNLDNQRLKKGNLNSVSNKCYQKATQTNESSRGARKKTMTSDLFLLFPEN